MTGLYAAHKRAYALAAQALRQFVERGGLDSEQPLLTPFSVDDAETRALLYEACELVYEELQHWSKSE